jgi:signal transduction histidine kinase
MAPRRGLHSEVLMSLAVVMLTATGVLGAVLVKAHEAHLLQIRQLAARALIAEARSPLPPVSSELPGMRWWIVEPNGARRPLGYHDEPLDPRSLELAAEARAQQSPVLLARRPWQPLRLAVPLGAAGVIAVVRLEAAAPAALVVGLLLADALVFTVFGLSLLRRRVVSPLQRLAGAARAIADGDLAARAPAEGVAEIADVGLAFNEMTEALQARSAELEKVVSELRESNSELRDARAGLDRAERLAAVGRLAAGVAHEVGNPLGSILAFLDLVGRDPGISDTSREHLRRAAREGGRVRGILRQLLDFSRPPSVARQPVDLCAVCEETVALVHAQQRYADIAIEVVAEGDPPAALADPGRAAQIVLNLLLNAADAVLDGRRDPRIRVTVRPGAGAVRAGEDDGAAAARRRFDAVECRVADNGPGVAPEDRERIFDPFYTSKPPGDGTGLGLSNALRYAEEFGGSLELDLSDPAEGACFVLSLPGQGAATGDTATRSAD